MTAFFGTSAGQAGYFYDEMRSKLDGRNAFRVTTGRADGDPSCPGVVEGSSLPEQAAEEFAKYQEGLQIKLRKAALKDARIETSARRDRERVAAQPKLAAKSQTNIPSTWTGCDAGDPSSWRAWSAGEWLLTPPKLGPRDDIPDHPLTEISAEEVRVNGERLIDKDGWCRMPQMVLCRKLRTFCWKMGSCVEK